MVERRESSKSSTGYITIDYLTCFRSQNGEIGLFDLESGVDTEMDLTDVYPPNVAEVAPSLRYGAHGGEYYAENSCAWSGEMLTCLLFIRRNRLSGLPSSSPVPPFCFRRQAFHCGTRDLRFFQFFR